MAGSALKRLMAEYKRNCFSTCLSAISIRTLLTYFLRYAVLGESSLLLFVWFSELTLNPPEGILAGPVNEENFFEWEALITWVIFIEAVEVWFISCIWSVANVVKWNVHQS